MHLIANKSWYAICDVWIISIIGYLVIHRQLDMTMFPTYLLSCIHYGHVTFNIFSKIVHCKLSPQFDLYLFSGEDWAAY